MTGAWRRKISIALALGLLVAGTHAAAAAPLTLPTATRARLANGLQVVVLPSPRLPLVDFRLVVRAGSVNDPPGKEGLADLTAALMTQGAGPRDARALAEDVAFVGGTLDASAGAEQIVVTAEVLDKDFALGLELFRDVIVAPAFPDSELERKRDETLGDIAAARNDPSTVADLALDSFLLGASPLAHPLQGRDSSVRAITRDDVVAFHARLVRPDNALLAVVGDVHPKAVVAALEQAFAHWTPASQKAGEAYQAVPQIQGRRVLIVDKPEVTQSQIRMACVGVPRNHPDFYPIRVANAILGAGFTSRLVDDVRVNQGLTYGIGSRWAMYRNAGTFTIDTFTRNETIRKTIDASLATEKKLLEEGPTEDEVIKARRYITGLYPMGLQAPDALAAQLLDAEFYGLDPDELRAYPDRIDAVGMTDVRRALKSYFCVDDLRIVVVSNPAVARPQLEGLGPIEVRSPE